MSTSFRFNPFDDHHLVRELIEKNLFQTLISSQKDPELPMVPSYKHQQLEAPHHHRGESLHADVIVYIFAY